MVTEKKTCNLGANDAFLDESVFTGIDDFLEGKAPLDPQTFYNLSTIVEAVVLHRTLWHFYIGTENDTFAQFLTTNKQIRNILEVHRGSDGDVAFDFYSETLDGWLVALDHPIVRPRFHYNKSRPEQLAKYLKIMSTCMAEGPSYLDVFQKHEATKDTAMHVENMAKVAIKARLPIYHDILTIPFRLSYIYTHSIPVELYRRIADRFKLDVQRIYCHIGMKPIYIPPLVAILLQRCKSREDIPGRLLELREEFREMRKTGTKYESIIRCATKLGDKIDAMDELEAVWKALLKKISPAVQHTKLVYRAWDIMKTGAPRQIATSVLDQLFHSLREREIISRIDGCLDLWNAVRGIEGYENLIEKVFKERFNVELYQEFERFVQTAEQVIARTAREKGVT